MRAIRRTTPVLLLLSAFLLGCGDDEPDDTGAVRADGSGSEVGFVELQGAPRDELSREQLEQGRNDAGWKSYLDVQASADTGAVEASGSLDDISMATVNGDFAMPVKDGMQGPGVLAAQILLDRARFSPGVMDGRWGKNTEKAVYWFQRQNDLEPSGHVDDATLAKLRQASGGPRELVREHSLTASDVEGPFVSIPSDIYEQAELDCMCYESLQEKLAELFHATPDLLGRLNPGVDLGTLTAGASLNVPAVGDDAGGAGSIARIVISDGGHYVHALDAQGRVVYHFPSTLGSDYAPSPSGDFSVESIHPDPEWHYQPGLLTGVPDDEEDAMIPAGPNNAVGVVWMRLSKPHYGIHGTSAPETIGYATSHGCVRLTNWDAKVLSEHISGGIPVQFIDSARGG